MPKSDSKIPSTARPSSGTKRRAPSDQQHRRNENAGRAGPGPGPGPGRTASSSSNASSSPQNDFDSSDPYVILGVSRDATPQQIKSSYRKLALRHHPDRQSSEADKEAAHSNFAAIGNAYEILGDEERRGNHDEERRRDHDESVRQRQQAQHGSSQAQQQQGQHGSSRTQQQQGQHGSSPFDDMGGFRRDPSAMFNDPVFQSQFAGGMPRGDRGRSSRPDFQDPFDLFNQFFAEEMGNRGRRHSSQSSGRGHPFASDPFFSSQGSPFGGGGLHQMMSGHYGGMGNSMMSQMAQMHAGSMFGGFDGQHQQSMRGNGNGNGGGSSFSFSSPPGQQQQSMRGNGNGGGSSFSFSSSPGQQQQSMRSNGNGGGSSFSFSSSSGPSSNRGGHQSVSTSTRTVIVNGVRQTVTERTVVHPDGRVERQTETVGGGGNDASRISTADHHDGGGRRRRH